MLRMAKEVYGDTRECEEQLRGVENESASRRVLWGSIHPSTLQMARELAFECILRVYRNTREGQFRL